MGELLHLNARPVAIVGSTNRGDDATQARARQSAYCLGGALARNKLRIVVYSDQQQFIEFETVRGYLDSGAAAEGSIEVRYPEKKDENGKPEPPPFHDRFHDVRFRFLPDSSPDWEVSYYTSFQSISGMLVLQGGRSALVSGLVALGYRIPLAPCGGFGGAATQLVSICSDRNLILADERATVQLTPGDQAMQDWAKKIVGMLQTQRHRLSEIERNEQAARKLSRQAMGRHVIVAVAALVLALALWLLNLENGRGLAPPEILAMLFLCSGLAGVTGTMLWVILPFLKGKTPASVGSVWSSIALGLLAGGIAALLFILGGEHGLPEMHAYIHGSNAEATINQIKADFFAGLIPGSMLSSLAAGASLDRALAAMATAKAKGLE